LKAAGGRVARDMAMTIRGEDQNLLKFQVALLAPRAE
jgi:hypothetical protein